MFILIFDNNLFKGFANIVIPIFLTYQQLLKSEHVVALNYTGPLKIKYIVSQNFHFGTHLSITGVAKTKRTDLSSDQKTNRQTDQHTDTDRETDRPREQKTNIQTQTDRQKQTVRLMERQTDLQTNPPTYRQRPTYNDNHYTGPL